jgi:Antibiotic biosynthesis monooxygenase
MFIAMNRFRVKKGSEDAFEEVWLGRDTYLDRVPGFLEFHLLKGPEAEDYTLYSSHSVWQSKRLSRRGPSRKNFGPRTRVPATRQLGRSIWSILNLRASRCARLSPLERRRPREPQLSRHHSRVSLSQVFASPDEVIE